MTKEAELSTKSEKIYIKNNCSKHKNHKKKMQKVTKRHNNSIICFSYERCMKNKCKTCKNSEKCKA